VLQDEDGLHREGIGAEGWMVGALPMIGRECARSGRTAASTPD
jgi:hypothetical protein